MTLRSEPGVNSQTRVRIPRFGESVDNAPPFPKTSDPRGSGNLDPTVQISLEINGPDQILAFHLSGFWRSLHPLTPDFESPKMCMRQINDPPSVSIQRLRLDVGIL
jgi:hypothetical protein